MIGGNTKTLVMDLDGTLTVDGSAARYEHILPNPKVAEQVRRYAAQGFRVAIVTSRNMQSFANSIGRINAETLPVIVDWLRRHDIPFDEVHVGKPWCGKGGFYVDDRTIRPSEFLSLELPAISALLDRERSG
ncbi:MAG: capsular biosynthesis protein [Alphaproteobacteria bacterium]|jgi:capsule biosynthesis phosphatase|nr:capsular biosynthesis protein [Alphaproteobacteria bacterium]